MTASEGHLSSSSHVRPCTSRAGASSTRANEVVAPVLALALGLLALLALEVVPSSLWGDRLSTAMADLACIQSNRCSARALGDWMVRMLELGTVWELKQNAYFMLSRVSYIRIGAVKLGKHLVQQDGMGGMEELEV
ncbi:hypothetical protein AXG93_4346s1060 [Marchantia polymorpha subsp. ruderalis]|uniref:Uncharacterized protein n=1 Tax=Marchantia polymorpha subsp. ruderalis TaxID=1480154 RepID=A0A176WTD8_MARPO|nr:hypothetical protein AXG93_4346s1060 [Marchantia polymorpha subsp. ruderalis]